MRVLHLWDNYAPGLFDHSLEICRDEGIEAALACMNLIGDRAPAVRYVRRASRSAANLNFVTKVRNRLRRYFDERAFRVLARAEIERFKPDVLHVHYGTTGALLAADPTLLRTPFVVSFYGFDISQGVADPAIRTAYQAMMGHGPLVHVLCDEAKKRAIALGARPDQIVDSNLPLPIDRYPMLGIERGVTRWLTPARFVEKKGHEILFRAFVKHLELHPDHRLTCWGYGDGDRLRERVRALGLQSTVQVVNNEHEPSFDQAYFAQLREHDAVLAPSIRSARGDDEGGPALTAVLAQVAGKPVILSDFPGSERSVRDGVEGLIVPQGDADALAGAMDKLANDPDLARGMGARGRERAVREFSRAAYRDSLLGWYRRLTDEA